MRDILFRGKSIDDGVWFEGFYCPCCFGYFPCRPAIIPKDEIDSGCWRPVDIIPKTVGQYTGLTDKNGKRIYEGDILHIVSDTCDYDYKTSVGTKYGYTSSMYVDGDFGDGDFTEIGFAFDYWSNEDAEIEVIGNIHDNPELIGKGGGGNG